MDGLSQLEMLEEEERHARVRLVADRLRLAHGGGARQGEAHRSLRKLERGWKPATDRLHRPPLACERRP